MIADAIGALIVGYLYFVLISCLVTNYALFMVLIIAYKKYQLFTNRRFIASIVYGGIASIVLGSLLGYFLYVTELIYQALCYYHY
ncbi:hypothetical protein [Helicobacter valdiviensis]|uniref:hypothetical protein n=1 Tax=Helicobacter valdiviensis TaxID=1458358 RepID=UPI001FE7F790|nr:hypothetical protein [Helicobacter valdiviensis]